MAASAPSASPSIALRDATLAYPIGALQMSLKSLLFGRSEERTVSQDSRLSMQGEVTAFRDLTLSISAGERVGVVGSNGSGKSSLLRTIAGIYPLKSGTVRVNGQVQGMFDIGLGFEPDATGRENIRYRGLVMGCHPDEIAAREDEIVAFSELGDFIDLPIRSYSTGMLVRLAFSISTYLSGDILLLDEIFGAGDVAFLAKAQARMHSLIYGAGILMLASHSSAQICEFCTRAIWLERGVLRADGPPGEVTRAYEDYMRGGVPA
jgi:lipopolysaccharide transport system ATP-binding protein